MKDSENLETLLSQNRVNVYKSINQNNWFAEYKKDIELGKSFYEKFHFIEIFLRNKIDYEFQKVFGNNWLLNGVSFANKEQIKIQRTVSILKEERKKLEHSNILSNLSFGFWVGLFHGFYHDTLWLRKHNILKNIFPYLMAHERSLKQIERELDVIRKLRNRVFHFEPLVNSNTQECIELIEKYVRGMNQNICK